MSEPLKVAADDDGTHVANLDEFYVRRVNWLITVGRPDLIDEIADDCERRRTARPAAGDQSDAAGVATIAPGAAALPPRPVETGTRLAVARLRRSPPQDTGTPLARRPQTG